MNKSGSASKCQYKCPYKREAEADLIYKWEDNMKTEYKEIWPKAME